MRVLTAMENIALMGEPDPKYGQSYWGNVEEQTMPVKFNLMQQVDIRPGRMLFAEESEIKTSSKGNQYMQLRKVKLSEPEVPEVAQPEAIAYEEELTQIPLAPFTPTAKAGMEDTPSYESGTNARWALKLSTDTYKSVMGRVPEESQDWDVIEDFAKWLLGSFQRLKVYKTEEEIAPGHAKAKATAKRLTPEPDEEYEVEDYGG